MSLGEFGASWVVTRNSDWTTLPILIDSIRAFPGNEPLFRCCKRSIFSIDVDCISLFVSREIPTEKRRRDVLMLRCIGLSKPLRRTCLRNWPRFGRRSNYSDNWTVWLWQNHLLWYLRIRELDEGQILLDGLDITIMLLEERGIGLIFGEAVLYPHLNVERNLKLGDKFKCTDCTC